MKLVNFGSKWKDDREVDMVVRIHVIDNFLRPLWTIMQQYKTFIKEAL